MNKEQLSQNITAIFEKAQRAGIFTLQESVVVLQTFEAITALLKEEEVEEEPKKQ